RRHGPRGSALAVPGDLAGLRRLRQRLRAADRLRGCGTRVAGGRDHGRRGAQRRYGRGPGALGAALVGPRQPPHPPRGRPRGGRAVTVREIDLTPRRLPGWLERFRTEHEAVWSLAGG